MCDEIGEQGTYHTHIYFVANSGVMFDTVQKRFYGAHIDKVFGTNEECYNYVRKIGEKHANKKETNLPDTFEEFGILPEDRKTGQSLSEEIYGMIKNGYSNYEIIEAIPNAINKIDVIDKARQTLNEEKYKNQIRKLEVYYLWGEAGSGKTRYVMDKYGYSNVYRVTNYKNPFDSYKGQDVILFEEFRSSIDIKDILSYLDIYPLMLPCRYADKVAQYIKVYFATNIPIEKQYVDVQHNEPETYKAFLRRIKEVKEIKKSSLNYEEEYEEIEF